MIRIRYGAVKCNTTECCKPSIHVNIVVFFGTLDQKVQKEIKRGSFVFSKHFTVQWGCG